MRQETAADLLGENNIGSAPEGSIENFNSKVYDKLNEKLRDPEIAQLAVELRDHIDGQIEDATAALEPKKAEVNQEEAALVAQLESQGRTQDIAQLKKDLAPIKEKEAKLDHTFKDTFKRIAAILFLERSFSKKDKVEPVNPNSFQNRDVAAKQLKETGLTDERESARTILSKLLYRAIAPIFYRKPLELIKHIAVNLSKGRDVSGREAGLEAEDAWRFYLGLKQENNTLGVSDYRPEKSKDDKYYYKINNWLDNFGRGILRSEEYMPRSQVVKEILSVMNSVYESKPTQEQITSMGELRRDLEKKWIEINNEVEDRKVIFKNEHNLDTEIIEQWPASERNAFVSEINNLMDIKNSIITQIEEIIQSLSKGSPGWVEYIGPDYTIADDIRLQPYHYPIGYGVMGQFKLQTGHDKKGSYISYYDIQNFGPTIEGENGLLGKPYELYDRIYYDPVTFEPIT